MWGWEPRTVTAWSGHWWNPFSWRWTTVREPEWSVRDIALLLAAREQEPVNSLGIPLADALNIANEFRWVPPTAPTIDWSLKSRDDAMDKYYKQYPDGSRNGHMWRPPTLNAGG